MKTKILLLVMSFLSINTAAYPHSARHHAIEMSKSLIKAAASPMYGTFIAGPKNVREAYRYEVWEREKPEKNGLLRYRLLALWRAPGEETKGIIDGLVDTAKHTGNFLKEFLSIFFSD